MARTETRPWDAAEHLKTEEDMAAYLEAALEDGDGDVAAGTLDDGAQGIAGAPQAARHGVRVV